MKQHNLVSAFSNSKNGRTGLGTDEPGGSNRCVRRTARRQEGLGLTVWGAIGMTCIVAIGSENRVIMGADCAGVSGLDLRIRKDRKIYRVGHILIGFTTSYRMGQLLGFNLTPPKRHPGTDLFKYMVTDFIDAVRDCLKTGGYTSINNNREESGEFLVATEGRVFHVYDDFQVAENAIGFDACGSGAAYAMGAMYTLSGATLFSRVNTALNAALTFSAGVRNPFQIETIE